MWTLRWSMRHRWAIVVASALVVASLFPIRPLHYPGLVGMIGLDFIPKDDQSEFEIAITTPEGWTLDRVSNTFDELERKMRSWPEVTATLTTIGDTSGKISKAAGDVTTGGIYVRLIDLDERRPGSDGKKFDQFTVMARARQMLKDYPDLRVSVQLPAAVSSGSANADV